MAYSNTSSPDVNRFPIASLIENDTHLSEFENRLVGQCPLCHAIGRTFHICGVTWFCHACERGGDAFSYIMARDEVTFFQAWQALRPNTEKDGR